MLKLSQTKKLSADSFIYAIVNVVNGKRYIGSTNNINRRMREHKKMLRKGVHHCSHLQKAFNLYGETSFQVVMIECCSVVDLIESEQKWFDYFGRAVLYNSTMVAEPTQHAVRPVFAICSKTGSKKRFESVREAAVDTYGHDCNTRQRIFRSVYNYTRSHGYYWTYLADETLESISQKSDIEKKIRRRKRWLKNKGEFYCFDKNGVFIQSFVFASEAAKWCGSSQVQVKMALRSNAYRKAGGYFWSYSREFEVPVSIRCKSVKQIKDGSIVKVWNSASDASRNLNGITHKGISEAAIGRQKTHGGYQWEFVKI